MNKGLLLDDLALPLEPVFLLAEAAFEDGVRSEHLEVIKSQDAIR